MRLLYIANIRMPTEKAHGVQITKMCELFGDQGVEVTLAVSNRSTPITADSFAYYGVKRSFAIRRLSSLDTVRYGRWGFRLQTLTFLVSATLAMLRMRPNVVYTREPLVVLSARICGIRTIAWEIHTAYRRRLCRFAGRSANLNVAISGGLATHVASAGVPRSKIIVEHDGVELGEFETLPDRESARAELELPATRDILGYVGKLTTMGEQKGVEELIAVAGSLKNVLPNIFLLLVGLNPVEQEPAEALAKKAGLVRTDYAFVTHVPRARVPMYLRACSVLVMNYPNTPHYAHMMSPLKLFEYMASSTPIVSSDLPSIREILDDESAILITPNSTHALQKGIYESLTQAKLAEQRAQRALELAATYTWNARAERILREIYAV